MPTDPTPPTKTPDVAGRCPACGGGSLMLADGGHITCRRLDCPNPAAVDDMLTIRPKPIDLTAMAHADPAAIAALKAAVVDLKPGGVVTPPAGDPVAATIARVEAIVDRLYLNMRGEVRKVEAERDRLAARIAGIRDGCQMAKRIAAESGHDVSPEVVMILAALDTQEESDRGHAT